MVKLSDEQIRDIAALREKMRERVMRLHEELEEANLCIVAMDMALKRSSFTKASEYTPAEEAAPVAPAEEGANADVGAPDPAEEGGKPEADVAEEGANADVGAPDPAEEGGKPEADVAEEGANADVGAPDPAEEGGHAPQIITTATGDAEIGSILVRPDSISITLSDDVSVSAETPPFKTFFLDRIFGEMKRKDAAEVEAGRMDAESAISCEINTAGGLLKGITIANYRTDDRAREIDSTVRWVLNRMLEHAG